MLRTAVALAILFSIATAQDGYIKVLLRDIDNPAGTLKSGDSCADFGFIGGGCDLYLKAGIKPLASIANATLFNPVQITFGSNKATNLNTVLSVNVSADTAFTGFTLAIQLFADADETKIVDDYVLDVPTTASQGVSAYASSRPATVATTVTFAWTTNLAQSTSTVAPVTTAGTATTGAANTGSTEPAPSTTGAPKLPQDCDDFADKTTGMKTIYLGGSAVQVYCEFTAAGAYTTIQSRGDGDTLSFDLQYENYTSQFGTAGKTNNFWLGLDNMNTITSNKNYSLEIDLCCGGALVKKLLYHKFKIGDASTNYTLTATADVAKIGLAYTADGIADIGAPFATHDRFVLPKQKVECDEFDYESDDVKAVKPYGGWWYGGCGNNLNGFMVAAANLDKKTCQVQDFGTSGYLGVNMRTTADASATGYDVDLISYDRVRMVLYSFDSLNIDPTKDTSSFCSV